MRRPCAVPDVLVNAYLTLHWRGSRSSVLTIKATLDIRLLITMMMMMMNCRLLTTAVYATRLRLYETSCAVQDVLRSDFTQVYVAAFCHFFICSDHFTGRPK